MNKSNTMKSEPAVRRDAYPQLDLLNPALGATWLNRLARDDWEKGLALASDLYRSLEVTPEDERVALTLREDANQSRFALLVGRQVVFAIGWAAKAKKGYIRFQWPRSEPTDLALDAFQPAEPEQAMLRADLSEFREPPRWLEHTSTIAQQALEALRASPYRSSDLPFLHDVMKEPAAREAFIAFATAPLDRKLVETYKRLLTERGMNERYKWQLFEQFKAAFELDAPDFGTMQQVFRFGNLLDSRSAAFLKPLFEDPETARAYFRAVLDESQSIEARLNFAHEEGARILKEKAPEWSTAGQDERTVSLYWAALNIAEHIPYKASFYRDYCKRAGISPAPVRRKYPHYRELMRAFIDRWVRDDEVLLELHAQAIEGEGFADPSHHLLGQTLWYTVLSQVWQREADSVPEPDFKERRYFIFQANPRIWSLEEHLRDEDVTDWSVSRLGAEMSPGDRVILWQSGERRGAYALAEITSELMPRVPESEALSDFTHGVELEVTDNWGDEPVLYSEIEGLKCFPTHLQGTNFRASAAQYFALKEWRERRAQGIGRRIWKVAPGEGSKLWAAFQAEAVAAVDWDMGDLARFEQVDQIEAGLHSDFPNERKSRHATAQTLWDFSRRILPGDFIVAKNGMQGYHGIGQVTGLQAYVPDSPVGCYQVPVDWLRTETKASTAHRLLRTFQEITDDTDQLNHLEALYGFSFNRPAAHEMKFGLTHLLADSFLGEEDVAPILTALKSKRNIILQGPPGTGKTFIAKRLAYAVMGEKDPDRVRMVQFHQSYSYEDFIQGFRPTDEGTFERRDGVFHRFCQQAAASPDAPHCFIIDEINRGNLSKIFGELMMLIEADKRGPDFALELTYSQAGEEPFHIPDNVYLIGTMNTADRSLALVDYALRRRFAFFNLTPQFNAKFRSHLDAHGVPEDVALHIIDRLNVLNEAIRADKNLGWGFEIGHSYFCKPSGEEAWYDHVIDHEVGPMLREYWFDNEEEAMRRIEALKA